MTHSSRGPVRPPLDLDSDERPIATALEGAVEQAGCPQPDVVRLLDAGVLPADVVNVVRKHVAHCRACQALASEGVISPNEAEETAARRRVWARIAPSVTRRPLSTWRFWRRPAWPWRTLPAFGMALAALVFFIARIPVDVPPVVPMPPASLGRAPALSAPSVVQQNRPVSPAPSATPSNAASSSPVRSAGGLRNTRLTLTPAVVLSPREGAMLSPSALDFRWQAVAGALYYEIQVLSDEGDVVWQDKLESTSVRVPEGHGLQAGSRYFIKLRACLSGGGTVASPPVSFSVGTR